MTALDTLIDDARAELRRGSTPDGDLLVAHGQWLADHRRRVRRASRVALVGFLAYAALAGLLLAEFHHRFATLPRFRDVPQATVDGIMAEISFGLALPAVFLGVAMLLTRRRSVPAQIGARALLWSLTVGVGVVLALVAVDGMDSYEGRIGGAITLVATVTCVGTLLVLGGSGLNPPIGRGFRPVRFRGLLTLSLVMGLSDAVILLTLGALAPTSVDVVCLALVVALVAAAFGIYRLRAWGLGLMALANLAEVVLATLEVLRLPDEFLFTLVATAVVQLALPYPLYRAIFRRRPPPVRSADLPRE